MKPRRIFRRLPPPWQIAAKNIYLKRKLYNNLSIHSAGIRNAISLGEISNSFNAVAEIPAFVETPNSVCNVNLDSIVKNIRLAVNKLSSYLQCVGYVSSYRDKRDFVHILDKLPQIITYISPLDLARLIISIDQSHIKLKNKEIVAALFNCLTNEFDNAVNQHNLILLFQSFLNLHGFVTQVLNHPFYRKLIESLTNKIYVSEIDISRLMILYTKHAIFDITMFNYIEERICNNFNLFDQDQIGNLARWLVKCLGFDSNEHYSKLHGDFWDSSHINFISSKIDSTGVSGKCKMKLLKILKHKALGAKPIKYIDKGIHNPSDEYGKTRLEGFKLNESKLIKVFSDNLPYVLHEYRYYNLVDVAEMYYMFGIKDPDINKRFGLEIWKHVARMKYGYQIKALIIFAYLETCDNTSFKWMMRNIPQTLTFTWEPEMICDCIISLEKISIRKMKLFDRLSIYLQRNLPCLKKSQLLVETSKALAKVNSRQPTLLHQIARLVDIEPNWMSLQQLISISSDCISLQLNIPLLFKNILKGDRIGQIGDCNAEYLTLIPQIYIFAKTNRKEIDANLNTFEVCGNEMVLAALEKILEDSKMLLKMHFTDTLKFLQSLANLAITIASSYNLLVELLKKDKDAIESKHMPAIMSIAANLVVNDMGDDVNELTGLLEELMLKHCKNLSHEETVPCLWYSHCMGLMPDCDVIENLCEKISTHVSFIKNEYHRHLMKVIACWMRCEVIEKNVDKLPHSVLNFIKNSDGIPDLSYIINEKTNLKIREAFKALGPGYKMLIKEPPFTIHLGMISEDGSKMGVFVEDDIYIKKLIIANDSAKFEESLLKPYYRIRQWYLGKKNWDTVYLTPQGINRAL